MCLAASNKRIDYGDFNRWKCVFLTWEQVEVGSPGHAAQWCLWDPGSSCISALTSLPCWFSSSCLLSLGPKMASVTAAVYTHSGRRCKGQKPFSLWVVVSWFTLTSLETLHGTFRSINGQGNWDYHDWFRPIIIIILWHWGRNLTLKSKNLSRASLVVQWLRIRLPMQGTRVRALVWEDPTCRGATMPVSHNYWACASGACALQQERPWEWEARTPRWRVAPAHRNHRKPSHRNEDPTQPKINKLKKKKKKNLSILPEKLRALSAGMRG